MSFRKVDVAVRESNPLAIVIRTESDQMARIYNSAAAKCMEEASLMPMPYSGGDSLADEGTHIWEAFNQDLPASCLQEVVGLIHKEAERLYNKLHMRHMRLAGVDLCEASQAQLASLHEIAAVDLCSDVCPACKEIFRTTMDQYDAGTD